MNDKELIIYNNESSTAQLLEGEIIFYQASENIRIEVRLVDETVWLTQQQMAELFNKDRTDIGRHIRNIYKEGELEKNITCAKFAHMGTEGDQKYEYTAYNLDVIISVGYRVKSKRGTKFRQWANKVLKEYLLRGYAINSRIVALERHAAIQDDAIHKLQDTVDFFVHTSLPPVEGIFYDGQVFDAYTFAADLIRSAQNQIILIDNYVDDSVLKTLTKRKEGVSATIITRKISETLQVDLERHNRQYSPVDISTSNRYHDRFLIVDNTVYHLGASLKDLGKKLFAFNRMEISAEEILSFSA
ncbi:MAG: DNA-binding protein [Bacteroidetes bacterium]|nr:DNA-binding protein [Bacteroidota bacterium]MBQ9509512.1 virulence RhuM family protein [Bacteroidales bacterium]